MSNFKCEICGKYILEGSDGNYATECEHYPFETLKELRDRKYVTEEVLDLVDYFKRTDRR